MTDSHPAIIDKTEWNNVQVEFAKRKASGRKHLCAGPFSGKLICGDCGAYFGSKVWHSTDKYRRVIWQCNDKFKNEKKCKTPHFYEEDIKRLFMAALNELVTDRTALIEDCEYMLKVFSDTSGIEDTQTKLMEEMSTVSILTENLISGNASKPMNQEEYNSQYDKYTRCYNKAKDQYDELQKLKLDRKAKAKDHWMLTKNSAKFDLDKTFDLHRYSTLLGTRYPTPRKIISCLLDLNTELSIAYDLKEEYLSINSSSSSEKAAERFDNFLSEISVFDIAEFNSLLKTMQKWRNEIINSFDCYEGKRISNGPIESVNSRLKLIKRNGNGYKNFERFKKRAIYSLNDDSSIKL